MHFFPAIKPIGTIDPDIRASAIDYVNRVNWLFETWDLEGMITAFLPDAKVIHFHGKMNGEVEIRRLVTVQ